LISASISPTTAMFRLAALILIVCLGVGAADTEDCKLLESAEEYVTVQFETDRYGELKSLEKAEVTAYFKQVVERDCFDRLTLMIQQSDGSWKEIDNSKRQTKRKRRAGHFYTWKVSPIVPCKTNLFRVGVGENYIQKELAPASLEDLEANEFHPGEPKNLTFEDNRLTWEAPQCATGYVVEIYSIKTEVVVFRVDTENTYIDVTGVDFCEEFQFTLIPKVGQYEVGDNEVYDDYTVAPDIEVIKSIDVEIDTEEYQATVSWDTSLSVSCIDKYEVQICETLHKSACKREVIYESLDPDNLQLIASFEDLKQATSYELTFSAIYQGSVFYKSPRKQFSTKLDSDGFNVAATANFNRVSISWSPVSTAIEYKVYKRYEQEEDWKVVADVVEEHFETEEEPCNNVTFAVAVLTEDTSYDLKATDTLEIQLDNTVDFEPENFVKFEMIDTIELSWDHSTCIQYYEIWWCSRDKSEDECNHDEFLASEEERFSKYLSNLEPCTTYDISVLPVGWLGYPLELEATTQKSVAAPPAESIKINLSTNSFFEEQFTIEWDKVKCADSYKLEFVIDGREKIVEETANNSFLFTPSKLRSCTKLELEVFSISEEDDISGSNYADYHVGPKMDQLQKFTSEAVVAPRGVDLRYIPDVLRQWDLDCVEEVKIEFCPEQGDCSNSSDPKAAYFYTEPASTYFLTIDLFYNSKLVHSYTETIRTPLDFSDVEIEGTLIDESDNLVLLEWNKIEGAEEYFIQTYYENPGIFIDPVRTKDLNITVEQDFCSLAVYTLQAVIGEEIYEHKIASNNVTTFMNDTEPFRPEYLEIDLEQPETVISWEHNDEMCVDNYLIVLNDEEVFEQKIVTEAAGNISVALDLPTCKEFDLKIVPRMGERRWSAEPEVLRTFMRKNAVNCEVPKVARQAKASLMQSSGTPSNVPSTLCLILTLVSVISLLSCKN